MSNEINKRHPLTEEDIMDLADQVKALKDFLEDLTGILYDNTELPSRITEEIESLYAKKFP